MTPLRRRMIEDMQLKNLAPRTIEIYTGRVVAFARHFGRSPDALGREEVRSFLLHLVQEKHVSWSIYNQTVAALRFLYEVTLERQGVLVRIPCPKQPKRLPIVLSLEEVARFFAAVLSLKHRAILMTAYAAGLRISEVVALRVDDIDSQRMVLRVRQGKGRKDRDVMLSPRLLALLREYWKVARPTDWLFPGESRAGPSPAGSVHRICVQAAHAAGPGQARHDPYPASQLRHPPARGRHRPPDDPGPARAPQPQDHRGLHPRLAGRRGGDPEPARSARPHPGRGHSHDPTPARSGRRLPATRRCLPRSVRRHALVRAAPRPAATSPPAGPPRWAGTSRSATGAGTNRSPTTRAATATAPSARPPPPRTGWRPGKPNCCPSNTSTWSSPCRRRSARSPCRTHAWSTASCSRPPPRPCSRSPPTPSTSGPRSASWPCSTPGARTCSITPTCTASCPGAGSSPDGSRWVACRPGFFLPVRVLSRVFRGKFLALLRAAFDRGQLAFHGKLAALADPGEFQRRLADSAKTEWVVYAKPPFGGPEQVLKYLARYTHRVAISNRRLIALEGDEVEFLWKDYAHEGKQKTMTLKAIEFIRRFLLHVLPAGFVRIRHYGFLANRVCQEKLALCRALLGAATTPEPVAAEPAAEPEEDVEGQPVAHVCPACGEGRMVIVETLRAVPVNRNGQVRPEPTLKIDTPR